MGQLKLSRSTGNGDYHTLAGVGITMELIHEAIKEVDADPNDVVLRFHDGSSGVWIDVMYPTPHTFLFDGVRIEEDRLCFWLGGRSTCDAEENYYELPLADPNLANTLSEIIMKRAKKHRKTKIALNCS